VIVVVAKMPRAGQVKTRLCPPLTPTEAALLAHRFLDHTLDLARAAGAGEVAIGFAPGGARDWFEGQYPDCRLFGQGEGDLGARMDSLFRQAFHTGARSVVLIGADTPHISPERIRRAKAALREGCDVVLGPAEDGGYYLIGLKEPVAEIFCSIDWGSATVFQETRDRAERLGLGVQLLPVERDIDVWQDLKWLRSSQRLSGRF
jgi:uncharacterized protein